MSNLWNNPMIDSARESLSKEDIQRYKNLGEEFYKNIDFEKASVTNVPPDMEDAINYLIGLIKSGLHPSMLEDNEKFILKDVLGDKWYEKYGFVKEDLDDIVTLKLK